MLFLFANHILRVYFYLANTWTEQMNGLKINIENKNIKTTVTGKLYLPFLPPVLVTFTDKLQSKLCQN